MISSCTRSSLLLKWKKHKKGGATMGDFFLLLLIFLMISYAYWDDIFSN